MRPRTLTVMTMLLDLKAAALDLLRSEHRNPALLNLYTFIDICASLSNDGKKQNREIFETYLTEYAVSAIWEFYTPYDLWAARSSLLHTYSPLGHHTNKEDNGARAIFYYSWPEKESDVKSALEQRGYSNFILIDAEEVKQIAIDAFNKMHLKIKDDVEFEQLFIDNAKHILPSLDKMRLEDGLSRIHKITQENST